MWPWTMSSRSDVNLLNLPYSDGKSKIHNHEVPICVLVVAFFFLWHQASRFVEMKEIL